MSVQASPAAVKSQHAAFALRVELDRLAKLQKDQKVYLDKAVVVFPDDVIDFHEALHAQTVVVSKHAFDLIWAIKDLNDPHESEKISYLRQLVKAAQPKNLKFYSEFIRKYGFQKSEYFEEKENRQVQREEQKEPVVRKGGK